MIRRLLLRLLGYKELKPHPLYRPSEPCLTPQDIARRVHKHAVLQARIDHFAEHFRSKNAATATVVAKPVEEKPDYRVGSEDAERRVEGFIQEAELAVDAAFYRAGL